MIYIINLKKLCRLVNKYNNIKKITDDELLNKLIRKIVIKNSHKRME